MKKKKKGKAILEEGIKDGNVEKLVLKVLKKNKLITKGRLRNF